MTQEFHLSITSLGSDRYLIRTEDTAMGVPVAEAQVEWLVEKWLQLAQAAMDEPLAGLLKGHSEVGNGTSDLHQLGEELYNALFQEEAIRESWLRAQGIAQNRDEILRFRLGLKESRLQRLPWEVLHHGGHPLTTRSDLTFARYAANFLVGQASEIQNSPEAITPLRALIIIASPHDRDYLKLLQEVRHIQEMLVGENEAILPIQLHVLEQPGRSELAQALEQGNYQVLHYAGHSDFGDNGGDLSLVNRQTGLTERLSGDDLAGLLVNNHVSLTVFNSCRSGHTAGDDAEMDWRQQNLVQALVNRGVPSVIAMAERIPDEVAIAFTQLFYKNLRKGFPIDLSLSRTRQGLIAAFGSDQHYWALPILYLQPDFDGYLAKRELLAQIQFEQETIDSSESAIPPGETSAEHTPVALLPEFETSVSADNELDEAIADIVDRVSDTPTVSEEVPLPANGDSVPVSRNSEPAETAIYNPLSAVPTQPETPLTSVSSSGSQLSSSQNGDSSQSTFPRQSSTPVPGEQTTKQIPLIWLLLGLILAVGVVGLGVLRLIRPRTVTEPPSIQEAILADSNVLIEQAKTAIQEQRYGDAREDFELALTQELLGKTKPDAVSDAILPLVSDVQQPDLMYVRGRIIWQNISKLGEDEFSVDRQALQRTLAAQAQAVWENVDNTFIKGRIAQGFAYYATGNLGEAITSWDAALALYDKQRQNRPNPAAATPADPVILHAYAGLVMARTQAAKLNLDGLAEDEGLAEASAEEQDILRDEADKERAIAQEQFLQLQKLDANEQMSPGQLQAMNDSPETWNNWFWTDELLRDWRSIYREWAELSRDPS